MNKNQQESLNLKCLNDMKELMQKRNQKVTKVKEDNWYEIFKTITKQLYGKQQRSVIPLEAGGGKSTAIGLWVSTWLRGCEDSTSSVLIAVSKLDELKSIYNDLVSYGLDESILGVYHNSIHRKDIPKCDANPYLKRVVITTHQMMKFRGYDGEYNFYRGHYRKLVIWDEQCISGIGHAIGWKSVRAVQDNLLKASRRYGQEDFYKCYSSLDGVLRKESIDIQKGQNPQVLHSPLEDYERDFLKRSCSRVSDYVEVQSDLNRLLTVTRYPFAFEIDNKTREPRGLLSFELQLDRRFTNMVILNASHHINPSEKADKRIKEIKMKNTKKYSNVTISTLDLPSGREQIEQDMKWSNKRSRYIEPIAEIIASIPENECVLVFHRKKKNVDIVEILLAELEKNNINTSRVKFLSWGNHTATNDYSDCKHIIMLGLYNRDPLQLKSEIKGQMGSISSYVSDETISRWIKEETAQVTYQGIMRGIVRRGGNKNMNVYMTLPLTRHSVLDSLRKVMPGFVHKDLSNSKRRLVRMSDFIANTLNDELEFLKDKAKGISVIKVNKSLKKEFPDLCLMTYSDAHSYFRMLDDKWNVVGNTYFLKDLKV